MHGKPEGKIRYPPRERGPRRSRGVGRNADDLFVPRRLGLLAQSHVVGSNFLIAFGPKDDRSWNSRRNNYK